MRYETYILYCTRTPIRRVDYTRVLKTTESGIGRKDGNLLSFFPRSYFPRRDWGKVVVGGETYQRISFIHTNYFIHIYEYIYVRMRKERVRHTGFATDRVSSDSRCVPVSIRYTVYSKCCVTIYILSLYLRIETKWNETHIPTR